jgi:hypothetical protein
MIVSKFLFCAKFQVQVIRQVQRIQYQLQDFVFVICSVTSLFPEEVFLDGADMVTKLHAAGLCRNLGLHLLIHQLWVVNSHNVMEGCISIPPRCLDNVMVLIVAFLGEKPSVINNLMMCGSIILRLLCVISPNNLLLQYHPMINLGIMLSQGGMNTPQFGQM